MNNDLVYHACRLAFALGKSTPWYYVVHALREGLGMKSTYVLQETDYRIHPDLRELVKLLKEFK